MYCQGDRDVICIVRVTVMLYVLPGRTGMLYALSG